LEEQLLILWIKFQILAKSLYYIFWYYIYDWNIPS